MISLFHNPRHSFPETMKPTVLTHPATSAFGLTVLCYLGLLAPLVSPNHLAVYHASQPLTSVFLTIIVEITVSFFAWFAILQLARLHLRCWVSIWIAIVFLIPWIVLKQGALVGLWIVSVTTNRWLLLAAILAAILGCILWRPSFLPTSRKLQNGIAVLLGFQAIYGLLLLAKLFLALSQTPLSNTTGHLHPSLISSSKHPSQKLVWIVLDELSYQQIYEHRLPGLSLPGFDSLAAQSTLFTHVIPAGASTELILPTLMTGISVDAIRSSADGSRLTLHNLDTRQWQPFNQSDTIFNDARSIGYSTAVVGWYNPYCRILPSILDHCTWSSRAVFARHLIAEASLSANLLTWITSGVDSLKHFLLPQPSRPTPDVTHLEDFRELATAADVRLADPSTNFLLLHIPIPHPGPIYNRATGDFNPRPGTVSYIDNLALADRYLLHIHQLLSLQGEWDSTTIVVMGDHSWRTYIWRATPDWSPEDEFASQHGRFDPRPAYILKLPGQQQSAHIDTPFAARHTRALLQAILSDKIRTPSDLQVFAQTADQR